MNLIIERSIYPKVESILPLVRRWGFDLSEPKIVEDITTQQYTQIDFTKDGRPWKLIFPANGNNVFFVDYTMHQEQIISYAGGAIGDGNKMLGLGDRISIVVFGNESQEVLELRFVHELLHAIDLPADSLRDYIQRFLSLWERLVFGWQRYKNRSPEQSPFWQRKFYKYLLSQRQRGLM